MKFHLILYDKYNLSYIYKCLFFSLAEQKQRAPNNHKTKERKNFSSISLWEQTNENKVNEYYRQP